MFTKFRLLEIPCANKGKKIPYSNESLPINRLKHQILKAFKSKLAGRAVGGKLESKLCLRGTQSFYKHFSLASNIWLLILKIHSPVLTITVQTFQPLNKICRRGYFVYYHWRCTSTCVLISYPLIFLKIRFFV